MKKSTMIIGVTSMVLITFVIVSIAMITPVCVNFYHDKWGTSWAVVVHNITENNSYGFGICNPGEYVRLKIRQPRVQEKKGDSRVLVYECFDQYSKPDCDIDAHRNPKNYFDEIRPGNGEPSDYKDTSLANAVDLH
jgi:hypothetical protein